MLHVLLILLSFSMSLSTAHFTEEENDAFKKLPKNPILQSRGKFHKFEENLDEFEEELNGVLLKLTECRKLPGVSISIVKPGTGVWSKGFGSSGRSNITGNTNFQIHALTRSFTTVLLIIALSEHNANNPENIYTLDTKMIDIMGPEYNLSNSYITNEVTLKDLLASRVGFRLRSEVTQLNSILFPVDSRGEFSREYKCRALKYMDDMAPFRNGYINNHFDWMLLGHIAEKLTGRSWEWLIENKILRPAGMTRTTIWNDAVDIGKPDTVHPLMVFRETNMQMYPTSYHLNNGRSPFEPSVGIIASGDDMAKWMYILLSNGRAPNGNQIFDSSLYFDTFEPSNYLPMEFPEMHRPLYPVGIEMNGISLPWIHGNYRGFRHNSLVSTAVFGTSAAMFLLRDVNVGLFIATRGPGKSVYDLWKLVLYPLSYFLLDKVIGLEPFYSQSNICTYPFYKDARDDFLVDKEPIDKMKVGDPDVVNDADWTEYYSKRDTVNGNNETTDPLSFLSIYSIVGFYIHPVYGFIHVLIINGKLIWRRSFSNLGDLRFYIGTINRPVLDVDFYFLVPYEYSRTYYFPRCKFFNKKFGRYQNLQIPNGGPIYKRLIGPALLAMEHEVKKDEEYISKLLSEQQNIGKQNLIPLRSGNGNSDP